MSEFSVINHNRNLNTLNRSCRRWRRDQPFVFLCPGEHNPVDRQCPAGSSYVLPTGGCVCWRWRGRWQHHWSHGQAKQQNKTTKGKILKYKCMCVRVYVYALYTTYQYCELARLQFWTQRFNIRINVIETLLETYLLVLFIEWDSTWDIKFACIQELDSRCLWYITSGCARWTNLIT